jgi:hypothetical protein
MRPNSKNATRDVVHTDNFNICEMKNEIKPIYYSFQVKEVCKQGYKHPVAFTFMVNMCARRERYYCTAASHIAARGAPISFHQ